MLQAFIKFGWICALFGGLLGVRQESPPRPQTIKAEVRLQGEGELFLRAEEKTWEIESDQTLEFSEPTILQVEAAAKKGCQIKSITLNTSPPELLSDFSGWKGQWKVEGESRLEVVFAPLDSNPSDCEGKEQSDDKKTAAGQESEPLAKEEKEAAQSPQKKEAALEQEVSLPLLEPYKAIGMDQKQLQTLFMDYAAGKEGEWKDLRLKMAACLGIETDMLDAQGFVLPEYFDFHSIEFLDASGGQILNPYWLNAQSPGQVSAPIEQEFALLDLGISITARQLLANIEMPGGNYMTNGLWTLSTGDYAFCASYINASPMPGMQVDDPVEVDNAPLRKALYYGWNGPGNILAQYGFVNRSQQILATDDLVSMANTGRCIAKDEGGGANWAASVERLWNAVQSRPDPVHYAAYLVNIPGTGINLHNQATGLQTLAFGKGVPRGYLKIQKHSAVPGVTQAGNANYSFAGAMYDVYKDRGQNNLTKVTTLTIDASGSSPTIEVDAGRYVIREISAPKGYVRSSDPISIEVQSGTTALAPAIVHDSEQPKYARPSVVLQKINALSGEAEYTLAGAHFEMKYYNLDPSQLDKVESSAPVRTWVMQTDNKGQIRMGDTYRISGPDFYRNERNEPVFPVGIVTFKEIKAPNGYQLNPTLFKQKVQPARIETTQLCMMQIPSVSEEPAGIVLLKMDMGYLHNLAGARFSLTSPSRQVSTLTTDSSGTVSLKLNELGIWTLVETAAPPGYKVHPEPIKIHVEANPSHVWVEDAGVGRPVTLTNGTLMVRDAPVGSLLRVIKNDQTGQPVEGATFKLEQELEGFEGPYRRQIGLKTSDRAGRISFEQELMSEGVYYLTETSAPAGYLPETGPDKKPVEHKIVVSLDLKTGLQSFEVDGRKAGSDFGTFPLRTLTENGTQVLEYKVINRKNPPLPDTGGSHRFWMVTIGSLMLLAAVWMTRTGGRFSFLTDLNKKKRKGIK